MQARSAASVDAILEATIQVLLRAGKERLTTTRVALRAGCRSGTLYQYFPNKSALLQAALKRHLDEVIEAVERVCREQEGNSPQMATALITRFSNAKMRDRQNQCRSVLRQLRCRRREDGAADGRAPKKAIVEMLKTSAMPLPKTRKQSRPFCRALWAASAGDCWNRAHPRHNSTPCATN